MGDAEERRRTGWATRLALAGTLVAVQFTGCAHQAPTPAAPAPVVEAPRSPLPRVCQELLPLGDRGGAAGRSAGELFRLLRRINPRLELAQRDCAAGDSWPIAYATGESADSGRPPIGFEVLRMTGDALLTFDEKNRDAPTVNLCRVLDFTLGPGLRVRAVALWDSADDGAFDGDRAENSRATLAWVELLSRQPSPCALGMTENPRTVGDAALQQDVSCARTPLVMKVVPACPPQPEEGARSPGPDAAAIEKTATATHRVTGRGRAEGTSSPPGLELRADRPELCFYEPTPAERDVCLTVYATPSGERWYGRGDVTRTGSNGVKNYVDSYLTFMLLKRIEAERKAAGRPATTTPAGGPAPAKN